MFFCFSWLSADFTGTLQQATQYTLHSTSLKLRTKTLNKTLELGYLITPFLSSYNVTNDTYYNK